MLKVNQQGFAQLAIILILLAGVGLGTYLVQQRTNILPFAQNSCEIGEDGETVCTQDDSINPPEPEQKEGDSGGQNPDKGPADDQPGCTGPDCGEKIKEVTERIKTCRDGGGKWLGNSCEGGTAEDTNGKFPSDGKIEGLKNCDATGNSDSEKSNCQTENERITSKNNETCGKDQVTYCDGGQAIRKTGGYFDSAAGKCVFAFYDVNDKDGQCSGAKDGNVVKEDAREAAARDELFALQQRSNDADAKCQSVTYCEADGTLTRKLSQASSTSGNCIETFQKIEDSSSCKKDGKNLAAGTVIENGDETKRSYSNYYKQVQVGELNTLTGDAEKGLDKITNADVKARVTQALAEAKALLQKANEAAEACKDNASCGASDAAQVLAVAKSREALAEAIKAGVPGVTVKMDLQIGERVTNSPISAKPSEGDGINRVFARTEEVNGKVIVNYLVRNTKGDLVLANINDLNSRNPQSGGFKFVQGQSIEEFGTFITPRITQLENDLTKGVTPNAGTGITQNTGTTTQPGSNQSQNPPPNQPTTNQPPQNPTGRPNGASCGLASECQTGFCNPISPGNRTGTCADSPATDRL